ncbi:Leukotoxin translocation ATP-binding protein [Desulfonema limicola]|uniref:Leukotoxin translocation ATP-binding protein n=1 Tax=Desulfonema limicola TaxID=45656 RepID=A0A975B805_9BACT|nr:peptidase domain-containing ABC transporter [Desulfonema limicola]QTA80596.1 Leukotoxin translocation ATP-binding protein [Desulfonema limicola]
MSGLLQFISETYAFSGFSPEDIEYITAGCQVKSYDLGDDIIKAGEFSPGLWLVRSGKVRMFTQKGKKEISTGICGIGDTFEEISIFKEHESEYSVRSSGKSQVLCFPREIFKSILENNSQAQNFIRQYIAEKSCQSFIVPLFKLNSGFNPQEIKEIVKNTGIRRVSKGESIIIQGDTENRDLYIVRKGKIRIIFKNDAQQHILADYEKGDIFGEKACITNMSQPAHAVADCDSVLLVIPRKTIGTILKQIPDLRSFFEKRTDFIEKEINRHLSLAGQNKNMFLFSGGAAAGRGEKFIRHFPLSEQAEEADCGAACLSMICRYHDINISTGKLNEMTKVTVQGATMESLVRTGESLGFTAKGVKCTYKILESFDLPLIVHWKGYHFIVIYGISSSHVWTADPGAGFKKMSRSEFENGWTDYCITFTPPDQMSMAQKQQSSWIRFASYLLPLKKYLMDIFFAVFIIQVLGLVPPVIIQNILDRVVVHQSYDLLNIMIAGLGIATIFRLITGYVSAYLMNFMIRKLDFNMISHFYKHILSLPVSFFTMRKVGDIIARFHENNTIRRFMTEGSISTVLNTLMLFTYFTVMFIYNAELTLILIAFLPPIIILTLLAAPKYKDYARKIFYARADTESILVETLGGAEVVKGMGIEHSMRMKWEKKYAKTLSLRYRAELFAVLITSVSSALQAGTQLTLLWVGTRMVLNQELTIGQLMAFNVLIGSVMSPVMGLVGIWNELQECLVSIERLGDILEVEPEQKPEEIQSRIILPELAGSFRFEKVFFRYGGKESSYILRNINLNIEPGQTIAVVGPSGSGKTTLAKLMTGFYKCSEGKIYVDDYDINLLDMESYRKHIGYVMQENSLFSGTISENIAIGDLNPDFQKITHAAKLADADGFIKNLPMQYGQVAGERGMGLSGGQIQRICIARALYHNPGLLIFDEATSSLDSESETQIHHNLQNIFKNRTAVIIAHRLSTVKNADKIIVLYEGSIEEQGNHEELINKKGMYYQLVKKQNIGD